MLHRTQEGENELSSNHPLATTVGLVSISVYLILSQNSSKRANLPIQFSNMARFTFAALSLLGVASQYASAFSPQVAPGRMGSSLNAVSKKDSYSITLLPGDGIGPEITEATKGVLAALCEKQGFKVELKEALIGGAAIDAVNDPFPQESLDQCLASDSVLLACIGGYKWDNNPRELRPESGLLKMRSSMGLFANLRPAKVLPQLVDASTLKREIVEGVDVMVVRELTGDVYFGTPKGIEERNGEYRIVADEAGRQRKWNRTNRTGLAGATTIPIGVASFFSAPQYFFLVVSFLCFSNFVLVDSPRFPMLFENQIRVFLGPACMFSNSCNFSSFVIFAMVSACQIINN